MIRNYFFIFLTLCILCSCATQKPPSGGPGDKEGPKLIKQYPENGTINFSGNELVFEFNEFLNRNSVFQALSIEPDLGITPDIKMGRKSFKLRFNQSLPAQTTVIIKLGNELKDSFGNALESPITLAFSTGAEIDQGIVAGALYTAENGKGEAGRKVFLYPQGSDPFADPAKYSVETDTDGVFQFSYIAEGFYQALWVEDANRNRIADASRESFSGFYQDSVFVSADSMAVLAPIYLTVEDTLKPTLFESGLLTSQRLNLQFSEPILFDKQSKITATDSTGKSIEGQVLYIPSANESALLVHLSEPLDDEQMSYKLLIENIKDVSGNRATIESNPFEGNAQKDSVLQRIVPYGIKDEYFYTDTLEFRYAKPINIPSAEVDSFFVNTPTSLTKPWKKLRVKGNTLFVQPDSLWLEEGINFNLWDPVEGSYAAYKPDIWSPEELGALDILFSSKGFIDSVEYEIRVFDDKNTLYHLGRFQYTPSDSVYQVEQLPAKKLRLVVFEDIIENGSYQLGNEQKGLKPERYFFLSGADIRSGFTTEIAIDFDKAYLDFIKKLEQYLPNAETESTKDEIKLQLEGSDPK